MDAAEVERRAAFLNALPFVRWDRCVGDDEQVVYGWIAREDGHADFVLIEFGPGEDVGFTTSSALYSREIMERIYSTSDGHMDCEPGGGRIRRGRHASHRACAAVSGHRAPVAAMTTPISAAADALKARHGTLLSRERPLTTPDDELRAAAVDEARERLRGSRAAKDQLSLDLRGR